MKYPINLCDFSYTLSTQDLYGNVLLYDIFRFISMTHRERLTKSNVCYVPRLVSIKTKKRISS